MKLHVLVSATATLLACQSIWLCPDAKARGFQASGAHGRAGGFSHSGSYGHAAGVGGQMYGRGAAGMAGGTYHSPYGGSGRGAGGGVVTPYGGAIGGVAQGTGAYGGKYQGSGGAVWKKGVGGVAQTNLNATTANGSTYSGFSKAKYNAQTGQGTYNSSRSYTNSQTGQQYGYTNDTSVTKGQGGQTTIDTANKGTYEMTYGGGQAATVTKTDPNTGAQTTYTKPTNSSTGQVPATYTTAPTTYTTAPTTYTTAPTTYTTAPTTYTTAPTTYTAAPTTNTSCAYPTTVVVPASAPQQTVVVPTTPPPPETVVVPQGARWRRLHQIRKEVRQAVHTEQAAQQ